MTQEELATKTGISVRTIQRIENGDVDPRSFTLQTIASVLKIEYEELLSYNKDELEPVQSQKNNLWLALLHLSGLFIMVLPPIIIWVWQKDKIQNIRAHQSGQKRAVPERDRQAAIYLRTGRAERL